WYRVTAQGAGQGSNTMSACLTIVGFPADNTFEVCISATDGQTPPTVCKSITPQTNGAAACVQPNGAPDTGNAFYVRVRKTGGSTRANRHAGYLRHWGPAGYWGGPRGRGVIPAPAPPPLTEPGMGRPEPRPSARGSAKSGMYCEP